VLYPSWPHLADGFGHLPAVLATDVAEQPPGIEGYYVVDGQDGSFATVTICKHPEAIEASHRLAFEWMQRFLASRVFEQKTISTFFLEVKNPLQGPLHVGFSEGPVSRGPRLLSVREICEEIGVGKSWVYQRLNSGEIPSIKLGGSVKVKREDLEEYLHKHRRHERVAEDPLEEG
jgi:excisionase family DNA binding protein